MPYYIKFNKDVIDDTRDAVLKRLSVLRGLENVRDLILDEVVDTPGSYADYYHVGAGVPFGLVSFSFELNDCRFIDLSILQIVTLQPIFPPSEPWPESIKHHEACTGMQISK